MSRPRPGRPAESQCEAAGGRASVPWLVAAASVVAACFLAVRLFENQPGAEPVTLVTPVVGVERWQAEFAPREALSSALRVRIAPAPWSLDAETGTVEFVSLRAKDVWFVAGSLDSGGTFEILYAEGRVSGRAALLHGVYRFEPDANARGRATVEQVGDEALDYVRCDAMSREDARKRAVAVVPFDKEHADPAGDVRIAVYLTAEAAKWFKSSSNVTAERFALTRVAELEWSLRLSGVETRMTLADVGDAAEGAGDSSKQGDSWEKDLDRLEKPGDGWFERALRRRDATLADVVVLLEDRKKSGGGLANVMTHPGLQFRDAAFAACDVDAATAAWAFVHEVGHVLGCGHDDKQGSYPFSRGFVAPDKWQTVMGASLELPHDTPCFSSPLHQFRKETMGRCGRADNLSTIVANLIYVSNFRVSCK